MSSKTWDEFVACSDALLHQGMEMVENVPADSLAGYFLRDSNLRKDEVALTVVDLIIGAMETVSATAKTWFKHLQAHMLRFSRTLSTCGGRFRRLFAFVIFPHFSQLNLLSELCHGR